MKVKYTSSKWFLENNGEWIEIAEEDKGRVNQLVCYTLFNGNSPTPDTEYQLPDDVGFEIETTCINKGERLNCANETCWDLNECQRNPELKIAHLKL
jgi:hypothetical protein